MFVPDRIKSIEDADATFRLPARFDPAAYLSGAFRIMRGGRPRKVRLEFTGLAARLVPERTWHPSQKIMPDPDHPGSILFEVNVAYPREVIWWMRRWCADAEVLEPREMREYMLEIAQQEVAMYANS